MMKTKFYFIFYYCKIIFPKIYGNSLENTRTCSIPDILPAVKRSTAKWFISFSIFEKEAIFLRLVKRLSLMCWIWRFMLSMVSCVNLFRGKILFLNCSSCKSRLLLNFSHSLSKVMTSCGKQVKKGLKPQLCFDSTISNQ